jgi:NADPH-dependent curcumin reductase CurA
MTQVTFKEIRLASRPDGMPTPENFELAEAQLSAPASGEVLVRNTFMSVDPYMRGRMVEQKKSYVPPFKLGRPLNGHAVGEVIASQDEKFKPGDLVAHMKGWREYALLKSEYVTALPQDAGVPPQAFLGVLGMPGLTAYAGLLRVGELKEGETVFVSAASGAVGSVVCQIARIKNCTVIGTAGSDEKCAWLEQEAGIARAINYKTCGDLTAALADACPKGIDVYFDNVGGNHLEAAIELMRPFGRIAMCGMIARYNSTEEQAGPKNLIQVVAKQLTLRGFLVGAHADMQKDFERDMAAWISSGSLKSQETIVAGIEKAPQAFIGLFTGGNKGKMLVQLN